jgi:hypothetical protein
LDSPGNDVSAGVFKGYPVPCLKVGQGMFCIPVKTLFTGTVLIGFAEEDEASAGNTVHNGDVSFRLFEFKGIGMGTAAQGGDHQLAIAMQGKAEEIDSEHQGDARKEDADHRKPLDSDDERPDDKGKKKSKDNENDDVALFQLGTDLLNVFFGIQFGHWKNPFPYFVIMKGKGENVKGDLHLIRRVGHLISQAKPDSFPSRGSLNTLSGLGIYTSSGALRHLPGLPPVLH